MKENAVKEHLISFIRQKLAEHELFMSEESLEFTAERYAWLIMDDPMLSVSKLLDYDIARLKGILKEADSRSKVG